MIGLLLATDDRGVELPDTDIIEISLGELIARGGVPLMNEGTIGNGEHVSVRLPFTDCGWIHAGYAVREESVLIILPEAHDHRGVTLLNLGEQEADFAVVAGDLVHFGSGAVRFVGIVGTDDWPADTAFPADPFFPY